LLCLVGISLISLYKIDRASHNANLEALAKTANADLKEVSAVGQNN